MTPEAPVTEAGRVSARETMVHRLEAAVRRHGVTVAPNVWLDDLDAIEAEAVARDRERIAELEHAIDMIVIGLESERRDDDLGWHKFAAGYLRDARYPHPVVEEGREAQAGGPPPSSAALAATPSPAPTDRDGDLTDIVDQIRPAISNAYYDARNAGETMEDAASRAAGAVLAVLQDAGLRSSPAPTAPLDVPMPPALPGETDEQYTDRLTGADRTGRVPYAERRNRQCSIGYHDECSESADRRPDLTDETRGCKCPCHAATPDQRHG